MLRVNKRTKEQVCCGRKASVSSLLIKPQMGKSQPQPTCSFLLLSHMFDMVALRNECVCERILTTHCLCPVDVPARMHQEHSVRRVQQDQPGVVTLSSPYRAERALTSASLCGKGVVFELAQLQSPQGATGTFTKRRKAAMLKSDSCWVVLFGLVFFICFVLFFGKNSSAWCAHGFKEQGFMWVAGNKLHFYMSSEHSSHFLLLSRMCCGLHRHSSSGFDHREGGVLSFDQTSPYLLHVTVKMKNHEPSLCGTHAGLVRWDLGCC